MLLFCHAGLVRPTLVLGLLRPDVDESVVIPLEIVQLLRDEVNDVGRHLLDKQVGALLLLSL